MRKNSSVEAGLATSEWTDLSIQQRQGSYGQRSGIIQEINREVVLLLGWGRAVLLQLAHPLVAKGILDHSSFHGTPTTRIRRLRHTLEAMLALTFGTPEEVHKAANAINAIHDRVHGKLSESSGIFPAGTRYSAHAPRLLIWVHSTLLDSFLKTYELYVGRLTPVEKDLYCLEASAIGPFLKIPEGRLPRSLEELNRYMDETFASDTISITETARRVAREVVSPSSSPVVRPIFWIFQLATVGMLPTRIREAYGFRWTWWNQVLLDLSGRFVRLLIPFVPSTFRSWPEASRFWFAVLKGTERIVSRYWLDLHP